jgi:hypothetical protein
MKEVLTVAEIQSRFDSEWVLVGDPDVDEMLNVRSGRILAHSRDRDEVYRQATKLKPDRFAVLFTGVIPEGTAIVL